MKSLLSLVALSYASNEEPCFPCKEQNEVSCDCSGMKWGKNFERELQKINPPSWFTKNDQPNALDLDLRNNEIGEIKTSLFDETKWSNKEIVKNLRTLVMNDCNITSIEAESFDDLGKLRIINLDNNQLEEIDEDLFAVQKAELNRVYIRNNRLKNIPKHLFRNMDSLNDLRLTGNLLHEIDPLAFENTASLHALYLDQNHLTQIHKQWFDTFHESWTNNNQEQHGQVFLNSNPWVCDCTTMPFVSWINQHPFFEDHYNSDTHSYVQMGKCQYPPRLRSKDFKGLELRDLTCASPSKFTSSDEHVEMSPGDETFEMSITVTGRPTPKVKWSYLHENDTEIVCDDTRLEFPEHMESNLDSYPVTHYLKPTSCDPPPTAFGEYTFVAHLIGQNSDGQTVNNPVDFTLTLGRDTTFWKVVIVTIILAMSFLICWRYRHSLMDTFRAMKGNKNVGMPAYAYQNVSTDQDNLINNEESERAYTPEKEMKINV